MGSIYLSASDERVKNFSDLSERDSSDVDKTTETFKRTRENEGHFLPLKQRRIAANASHSVSETQKSLEKAPETREKISDEQQHFSRLDKFINFDEIFPFSPLSPCQMDDSSEDFLVSMKESRSDFLDEIDFDSERESKEYLSVPYETESSEFDDLRNFDETTSSSPALSDATEALLEADLSYEQQPNVNATKEVESSESARLRSSDEIEAALAAKPSQEIGESIFPKIADRRIQLRKQLILVTLIKEDPNSSYEGQAKNGIPEGYGVLTRSNGISYEGSFKKGLCIDLVRVCFSHKTSHSQSKNGTISSQFLKGNYYEGPFRYGKMDGLGEIFFADKEAYYVGEFRKGARSGEGVFFQPNIGLIKGVFENSKLDGFSEIFFIKGSPYLFSSGRFCDGIMQGKGLLIRSDGVRYEGFFLDGMPHGSGTIYYPPGHQYSSASGIFENGHMKGDATIVHANGQTNRSPIHSTLESIFCSFKIF